MRLPLDTSIGAATAGISCLLAAFLVFLYYVRNPHQQQQRHQRGRR